MAATLGSLAQNDNFLLYSAATYLTALLTDFRNGPESNEDVVDFDFLEDGTITKIEKEVDNKEVFARRFTSELGYAALFVASVIETIVRGILAIPCMLIYCLPERFSEIRRIVLSATLSGAIFSAENAAIAFTALFKNISVCGRLNYDAIIPGVKQLNRCFFAELGDADELDASILYSNEHGISSYSTSVDSVPDSDSDSDTVEFRGRTVSF